MNANAELLALALGAALVMLVLRRTVMTLYMAGHLSPFQAALIVGLWFAILTLAPAVIGVWEWSVPLLLLAAGSFAVASLTAKSILVRITRPPPN